MTGRVRMSICIGKSRLWASLAWLTTLVSLAHAQTAPDAPPTTGATRVDPFVKPQEPANTNADAPGQAPRNSRDLTARVRLIEYYKVDPASTAPGLTQYQVGFRETLKFTRENAQGAPSVQDFKIRGAYTERVCELGPMGGRMVGSVLRRYDAAETSPNPMETSGAPPLAEGLKLWSREFGTPTPMLIVSAEDGEQPRDLYEHEYRFALSNPFLPRMSYLLPEQGLRIGDKWALTRTAIAALAGDNPASGVLNAELVSITAFDDPECPGMNELATIDVEGSVKSARGTTALRARIEFAFHETEATAGVAGAGAGANSGQPAPKPEDAQSQPNPTRPGGDVVGVGAIRKIRLAQVTTPDPATSERAAGVEIRRELIAQRRWPVGDTVLQVPNPFPLPTAANSWLTYLDPKGRFRFRHPPHYSVGETELEGGGEHITLQRVLGQGLIDRIQLTVEPGKSARPDTAFQTIFEQYGQVGLEKLAEETTVLPPDAWSDMEVHRIDAAFVPAETGTPVAGRTAPRRHFDGYVMMVPQNIAVTAYSETDRDDAAPFREEVESILKTLRLTAP